MMMVMVVKILSLKRCSVQRYWNSIQMSGTEKKEGQGKREERIYSSSYFFFHFFLLFFWLLRCFCWTKNAVLSFSIYFLGFWSWIETKKAQRKWRMGKNDYLVIFTKSGPKLLAMMVLVASFLETMETKSQVYNGTNYHTSRLHCWSGHMYAFHRETLSEHFPFPRYNCSVVTFSLNFCTGRLNCRITAQY